MAWLPRLRERFSTERATYNWISCVRRLGDSEGFALACLMTYALSLVLMALK